jgi:thiol-disulfide isomerase/thioredoxin
VKASNRFGIIAALLFSAVSVAMAGNKLAVGSPAPEMKVARWVKGTPVTSFEAGKVYVVEFWATWCGPCKQSIPHLTELAKKYAGKATFTGVSVYEKNAPVGQYANYGDKVDAFVKEWGDKMDYNVAWDGDEAAMSHNWMEAAGQGGIPTAFVVDRTGTVVWIGHPMAGLDEAVGQVIAGTFDVKAEAEKQAKAQEAQEKQMAAVNSYIKPLRAGDFKGAVAGIDNLIASDPKQEFQLGVTRYIALSNYDATAANNYARKLEKVLYKSQAPMLNSLAWTMVDDKTRAKGVDFNLAVEIAEKCVALTKEGDPEAAMNLDTLGFAYFKAGKLDKALTTQEKAVAAADATKDFDAATRKEIAGRLEQFKQKKS